MTSPRHAVLHVDDDPDMTSFVARLLQSHGIECESINDPTLAFAAVRDRNYRIVILDIDMPGLNGLELLQRIKRFDGSINVIMLTGLVSQSSVIQSLRRGACECLFKPINDPAPLLEALQLSFDRIDRWWNALRQLAEQKKLEAHDATPPSLPPSLDAEPAAPRKAVSMP